MTDTAYVLRSRNDADARSLATVLGMIASDCAAGQARVVRGRYLERFAPGCFTYRAHPIRLPRKPMSRRERRQALQAARQAAQRVVEESQHGRKA